MPQVSAIPWWDVWIVAISDTSQVIVATSKANKGCLGGHIILQHLCSNASWTLHQCGAGGPRVGPLTLLNLTLSSQLALSPE